MSWSAEGPKLLQLLLGVLAFVLVVGGLLVVLDLLPRLWAAWFAPPHPVAVPQPPPGQLPPTGRQAGPTSEPGSGHVQTMTPAPESHAAAAEPRDGTAAATGSHRPPRDVWIALVFLAPAVLLLMVGLIVPLFRTVVLSLHDGPGREWVGLENYGWMFTQTGILTVLRNTLVWVILAPLLATSIGLVYAILVDRVKLEWFAKSLVFLPMAISFVGASIIFRFMYQFRPEEADQTGLLNQVLVWLGLAPQNFILLSNGWDAASLLLRLLPGLNSLLLIAIMIWIYTGFAMVILSAAIKAIPGDIVEAARIDGTNPWQMFWQITLPSIKPSIIVVVVTISIATLKVFDIVRTMTGGQFDTSVIANEMYTQAFTQGQLGRGSALAAFLFLLVLPLVLYQVRVLRQRRLEAQ